MSGNELKYVVTRGLTQTELRWFLSLRDDGDIFLDLSPLPRRKTINALCNLGLAYELDSNRLCISEKAKQAKVLTGRRIHFLHEITPEIPQSP